MDRSKAYEILGITSNAGEEEVKLAYKDLARKYDVDNYEAGPLREEAVRKMNEINEAFDILMSYLRTGQENTSQNVSQGAYDMVGEFPDIRQLINTGRVDEALSALEALANMEGNAEWNFLMGSVYYYKGWLDKAHQYFENAVSLAPGNREYEAALRNLQNSSQGEMPGNPYVKTDGGATALNCACNTCALMCCLDACCGMGSGC